MGLSNARGWGGGGGAVLSPCLLGIVLALPGWFVGLRNMCICVLCVKGLLTMTPIQKKRRALYNPDETSPTRSSRAWKCGWVEVTPFQSPALQPWTAFAYGLRAVPTVSPSFCLPRPLCAWTAKSSLCFLDFKSQRRNSKLLVRSSLGIFAACGW